MSSCVELKTKLVDMEGFEEFMAEMLEEYNYDKDAIMVTTAFAQALANEWGKQLLIHDVSKLRGQLFAFEKWQQTQFILPDEPNEVVDMYLNSK
jgi:hypothetical protein